MTTKNKRDNKITEQSIGAIMRPYTKFYESHVLSERNKVIAPYRIRQAILANVSKTGRPRFNKGRPKMYVADTPVPTDAYLFWLLYDYEINPWSPIDSLLAANATYGSETYQRWETAVEVFVLLANRESLR